MPPFFRVAGAVGLLELLEDPRLVGLGDARARCRRTETHEVAVRHGYLHPDLAGLGELDGVADEVQEHLGDPPRVAPAGRQVGRHGHAQRELLLGGERLHARRDGLRDLLHGVVGEGQA